MIRPRADLLIVNGRPWSEGAPIPSADAIAVRDGRMLAIGRAGDLEPLADQGTQVLDARGATVTPGLTDAHIHLVAYARARSELDLTGASSRAEALERLRAFARAHPGSEPIIGRGWDANLWSERPERGVLDAVVPDRPVLLHSRDFHALWVNGAALARAGVDRTTPDPSGGRIGRDASGEPNGVVFEHAVRLFSTLVPLASETRDAAHLRETVRALHAEGITAVHDFEGAEEHRLLRALALGDGPRLRVLMHLRHEMLDHALALGLASGIGDDRFRIGALKLFADGTLGSRTAALLEPYDGTDQRGMELLTPEVLTETIGRAMRNGLSVAIHAIGDRAVRNALDGIAAAGPAVRGFAFPPRIEHVQLLDPEDLPRFAQLGVVASMQPLHCTSDIDLAKRWWGSRIDRSYPWNALIASGARLAFGSDAPVEPTSVAAGLAAATTRQRADGTPDGGFVPGQRLTLDEALRAYTEIPARLAGSWPRLGRIAAGATADLVVWNADLHAIEPQRLAACRPRGTLLEGDIVHTLDEGQERSVRPMTPTHEAVSTLGSVRA